MLNVKPKPGRECYSSLSLWEG
ncbi:protein of unknown function [Magnetospirillum sp. XM-1]|nr:protein of unknown function [Magnetospirillum sp. XM-1]